MSASPKRGMLGRQISSFIFCRGKKKLWSKYPHLLTTVLLILFMNYVNIMMMIWRRRLHRGTSSSNNWLRAYEYGWRFWHPQRHLPFTEFINHFVGSAFYTRWAPAAPQNTLGATKEVTQTFFSSWNGPINYLILMSRNLPIKLSARHILSIFSVVPSFLLHLNPLQDLKGHYSSLLNDS